MYELRFKNSDTKGEDKERVVHVVQYPKWHVRLVQGFFEKKEPLDYSHGRRPSPPTIGSSCVVTGAVAGIRKYHNAYFSPPRK